MDFWQSFALLGRRWVFFGTALLMAAAITAGVFHTVKAQYQATSELLLVPPAISSTATAGNFVTDYGNLNTVASIVSYREDSQQVATQLKAIGILNYTVSTDPTGAVPELIVTVTASSPPVALSENAILSRDVVSYLSQIQSGASPSTRISTRSLEAATQATRDDKSRIRVVVAVGVVCVFLAVALTSLYDSVRRRRMTPRGHERATSAARPGQATLELDVPLLADGRVSTRTAVQYGRRAGRDLGSRSVAAPGASSAPAPFQQDS
ncbi:MAG: hypothetical protein ABSA65_14685 [Acidimicrobiales bacterium]|jgi:hypothetical protein